MTYLVPEAAEVRRRLQALSRGRVLDLARTCGVPFPTLVKIRNGQTSNPGVETVRLIWPTLNEADTVQGAADGASHAA